MTYRRAALALALLAGTLLCRPSRLAAAEDQPKPIKALLILGGCCHDYATQQKILSDGIAARANVEVTVAYDPDTSTSHLNPIYNSPDWSKGFDVIIHDECSADVKDLKVIERILKPHRDGLPAVLLHCAMHSYRSEGFPDKDTPWFQFTGMATTGHGPHEPLTITFTDTEHPITKGMTGWTTGNEELYNNVRPLLPGTHALAKGKQGTQEAVTVWTHAYGEKKTKVFGTTLGHHNELVGDGRYLDLVTRGLLWSVDKLDDKHLKPARPEQPKAQAPGAPTDEAQNAQQLASSEVSAPDGCACEDDRR